MIPAAPLVAPLVAACLVLLLLVAYMCVWGCAAHHRIGLLQADADPLRRAQTELYAGTRTSRLREHSIKITRGSVNNTRHVDILSVPTGVLDGPGFQRLLDDAKAQKLGFDS